MTTTLTNIDRRGWILNNLKEGDRILDIGSADGWIFNDTPFRQYTTSIDIDKYNMPNFYQMDAHNLSNFKDKEFDIAILGEILEHVNNPAQVLREAKRVAKRILITVPNEYDWDKKWFPFETLEEQTKRRNLSVQEIVKVSNPNVIEFYQDNYNHLFHQRHYTQDTLIRDLDQANIKDYKLDNLRYEGWAFFTVDSQSHAASSLLAPPVVDSQSLAASSLLAPPVVDSQSLAASSLLAPPVGSPAEAGFADSRTNIDVKGPIINYGFQSKEIINITNQKDQKLRIALISTPFFTVPPTGYAGLEMVVWDLAVGLDNLGHEVTIFAPEGSISPNNGHLITTGPSIDTVGVDWFEEEKKRYNVYKDLITRDKYDVIADHTWFAFIYLLKMNDPRLKILHTHHGGMSWDSPPPSPIKPNLISISKWMKQYTEQYFKQIGFNIKSEYVYNGINTDKYSYQSNKTEHLLFVGRLSTFKQPHVAIEVARKTNHKLDLIGTTKFVDSIEYVHNLEKDVEKDPNITLYADASHQIKIAKLKDAKALIFPSKMAEPMGLVALEAMSCGTPVIATRDGAIPEVVIHNKTGFICDTIDEMVNAVSNIYKIKTEDCRKHVEENFSLQKMAKDYEKLCYRVMKGEEW